ncbi:hypothetical protein [Roseateles terrae]|uniref:STAS domain-containing protein n=1 Tax=Roseateles terrae TaxID=431060 RepID=A0ABR6H0G2_9BURK|nr:hypothetical protein [Roseateles terrae]MBB3197233.1 hypothetical protein [Roseateles terrae]OWQ83700.1 hypothetical protein CDN98_21920 [Roseateles terrae]
MTDPTTKDGESFFRKVARFVANPTTDWAEINSRQDDPEADAAKAELRAMVERKRRNDFVRKRELDMLRRIRREGLTPEQLAALGGHATSGIDELGRISEINGSQTSIKSKIDQIEQQMVGESFAPTQVQGQHPPAFFETSTRPVNFNATQPADGIGARSPAFAPSPTTVERLDLSPAPASANMGSGLSPQSAGAAAPIPELKAAIPTLNFHVADPSDVEVNEVVHDAELDEAVIAFANGDYEHCERSLSDLTRESGSRHTHADTWLVLFDLYRATGQQAKFEHLANDYAQQFGLSSPQWFSLPKLVAEAVQQERAPRGHSNTVAWSCPEYLDVDGVLQMRSRCENLPLPWVLDFQNLRQIDPEACARLREVFRAWAPQALDLRWLAGDHFFQVLKDQAPVGARDADPVYWMLRLEALRLANRPDQFDEVAIDYCVTYEVSPPSWEKAEAHVRVSGNSLSTASPQSSVQPAMDTGISFLESTITDALSTAAQMELSGQLSGDISETLKLMTDQLGPASLVNIACPKLIRLDFMAAGDLLNWVLARRSENRAVQFTDAHRLVALFFGAMGINEHARVKVRHV